MTTPIDRVLSGQSEMCVASKGCFVRDKMTRGQDGQWTHKEPVEHITKSCANEIIWHPCVVLKYEGTLTHYATRRF